MSILYMVGKPSNSITCVHIVTPIGIFMFTQHRYEAARDNCESREDFGITSP